MNSLFLFCQNFNPDIGQWPSLTVCAPPINVCPSAVPLYSYEPFIFPEPKSILQEAIIYPV